MAPQAESGMTPRPYNIWRCDECGALHEAAPMVGCGCGGFNFTAFHDLAHCPRTAPSEAPTNALEALRWLMKRLAVIDPNGPCPWCNTNWRFHTDGLCSSPDAPAHLHAAASAGSETPDSFEHEFVANPHVSGARYLHASDCSACAKIAASRSSTSAPNVKPLEFFRRQLVKTVQHAKSANDALATFTHGEMWDAIQDLHAAASRPQPPTSAPGTPDAERIEKLFRMLPFPIQHWFGGDAREFRHGIDAVTDEADTRRRLGDRLLEYSVRAPSADAARAEAK